MKQISYERVVEGPDTLRLYLKEISRFPQLAPEEEKDLGARVQKGDEDALRKLIESNLRFVVAMAKKYARSGYPLHELINEGNMGLIEAASRGHAWIQFRRKMAFCSTFLAFRLASHRQA